VRSTEVLGPVTARGTPGDIATRWAVHGTDLGVLWDDGDGGVLCAFGDTYGVGWRPPGAGPRHADWRFNALARSTCRDLSGGLVLDEMVEDRPGHAAEVLPRSRVGLVERTVIPTAGIAVQGRQYLHYMSVRWWGRPGRWRTNHGGLAVSEDRGRTWTRTWQVGNRGGRRPMQMGGFARAEDWVYFLHTGSGRHNPVHLARVPPPQLGDLAAFRYWTGSRWSSALADSRPVASGPAGELSVAWHRGLDRWLLVHLDDPGGRILLRSAEQPTGPWTDGEILVSGVEHPGLYGGFLHPWRLDGDEICFTMSRWVPYTVYLVRARLDRT